MKAYCGKGAQLWVIAIAQDEAVKRHNLILLQGLDTFT